MTIYQYIVGCRDDVIILRAALRATDNLKIDNLDTVDCGSFKDGKIWQQSPLQPKNGPGDTWENYCRSAYSEFFNSNINTFPCGETCGFCNGTLNNFTTIFTDFKWKH